MSVGYVGHICHLHTYWRCTGCWQSIYSYVSAKHITISHEHAANASHLPYHGQSSMTVQYYSLVNLQLQQSIQYQRYIV